MQKIIKNIYAPLVEEFNELKKIYGKEFIDEVNKSIAQTKKSTILQYYFEFDKLEYQKKYKAIYYWLDEDSEAYIKSLATKTIKPCTSARGYNVKNVVYDIKISIHFMVYVWINEIKKQAEEVEGVEYISTTETDKIVELYNRGIKVVEIAKMCRVSPDRISQIVNGYKRRKTK